MNKQNPVQAFEASDSNVREPKRFIGSPIAYELNFSGRHRGLFRLKNWVAQHGALNLTLSQAAGVACLTPHHLSAAFHKHTGETFKKWRCRVRIFWAVSAIETGKHSIDEVMRLAGYRDRRAFERATKQLTGATPGCIRKHAVGPDFYDVPEETQTRK